MQFKDRQRQAQIRRSIRTLRALRLVNPDVTSEIMAFAYVLTGPEHTRPRYEERRAELIRERGYIYFRGLQSLAAIYAIYPRLYAQIFEESNKPETALENGDAEHAAG